MTYIRVTERDDVILSAKLVEYSEMPSNFKQPGMFRTWRGIVGISVATVGWAGFMWIVWCVLKRVWPA